MTRQLLPQRRRGAAMMFTFLALMVFSVLGMALTSASMQTVRLSRFQRQSSAAFNLAESGAERAVQWLRTQSTPPSATTWGSLYTNVALGDGTYTVTYDGDDGNPGTELKRYTIRSQARVGSRQETVEVFLQQSNFGRFAYFTDYEVSSLSNGAIWHKTGETIDGPAHSNNSAVDGTPSNFSINWNSSTSPIFLAGLTGSGASINYNPGAPQGEADFNKIYANGSRGYRLGVPRIELPDNTEKQRNAAWGASTGFPTTTGVRIAASGSTPRGGVFINGDSTIEFVDGGGGIQIVQILQGFTRHKVTVNLVNNTTTLRSGDSDWNDGNGGGTVTNFTGVPNGVIYTTGHVTSLCGTLADSHMSGSTQVRRNAWTLATDVINGKEVTITNSVLYDTLPDKTQAWSSATNLRAASFGVVARNIKISSSAPAPLAIHGVMLAGARNTSDGSFYTVNHNSKTPPGNLDVLGGLIQKKRGPVGTFNTTTGQQSTGYNRRLSYDQRMAINPPPFFPTIFDYDRLSWARVSGGVAQQQQTGEGGL